MIDYYYCDACHYCFTAERFPDRCPDCGKQEVRGHPAVRNATGEEIAEYQRIQAEIEREDTWFLCPQGAYRNT